MLQVIHREAAAPRASSIYCRWITERRSAGERLVAVWMDSEMRCFEREFTGEADSAVLQDPVDEPGRVSLSVVPGIKSLRPPDRAGMNLNQQAVHLLFVRTVLKKTFEEWARSGD